MIHIIIKFIKHIFIVKNWWCQVASITDGFVVWRHLFIKNNIIKHTPKKRSFIYVPFPNSKWKKHFQYQHNQKIIYLNSFWLSSACWKRLSRSWKMTKVTAMVLQRQQTRQGRTQYVKFEFRWQFFVQAMMNTPWNLSTIEVLDNFWQQSKLRKMTDLVSEA